MRLLFPDLIIYLLYLLYGVRRIIIFNAVNPTILLSHVKWYNKHCEIFQHCNTDIYQTLYPTQICKCHVLVSVH